MKAYRYSIEELIAFHRRRFKELMEKKSNIGLTETEETEFDRMAWFLFQFDVCWNGKYNEHND